MYNMEHATTTVAKDLPIVRAIVDQKLGLTVEGTSTTLKVAPKVRSKINPGSTVTVKVDNGTAVELVDSSDLAASRAEDKRKQDLTTKISKQLIGNRLAITVVGSALKHLSGDGSQADTLLAGYLAGNWISIDGVDGDGKFSLTIATPAAQFVKPGDETAPSWIITGQVTSFDVVPVPVRVWHFGPGTSSYV
ncbi:hypothetical protein Vau01_098970 [Virgisporangium aurantiacum]|uniref:Uncharacterized protein n=2 Tax=Virgisporangium aurantiacum TaxID=175570 RepID=A0A8J4E5J7_9ACTN|nr:hypothetical protein Vau01_098970 [Virgisporangium aurantiacum]